MTDENTRALIAAMRDIERARSEKEKPYEWSEADLRRVLDPNDAEVRRLTCAPTPDPEVQRYLDL